MRVYPHQTQVPFVRCPVEEHYPFVYAFMTADDRINDTIAISR